jgi:predicted ribosome quality control (RQC) complex YloA/Tae2 family protein
VESGLKLFDMKSKFTSADVRAIVAELLAIPGFIGSRIVNIYDISQKTYIFKFDVASSSEKLMLLVDAGFRFHLTTYPRSLPDSPTPFTMILRRLRRKRLDSLRQLGFDRVVDLTFSGGDGVQHLIFEFYAGGNIVLTDEHYEVQALLRSHQFADDIALKVGEFYPVAYATQLSVETSPTLWNSASSHPFHSYESFVQFMRSKYQQYLDLSMNKAADGKGNSSSKKLKLWTLKQLLLNKDCGISFLGPEFLDHAVALAFASSPIQPNAKFDEYFISQFREEYFDNLCHSIATCLEQMQKLLQHSSGGHVFFNNISKPVETVREDTVDSSDTMREYEDFTPVLLSQHSQIPVSCQQSFPTFNAAVDAYFHHFDAQKQQRDLIAKEEALQKKLSNIEQEHTQMLAALTKQQSILQESAHLVELHADAVDRVCVVIQSALQHTVSWPQIEEMVRMEQAKGSNIAMLVSRLKLADNIVVVKLPREESEIEERTKKIVTKMEGLMDDDSEDEDKETDKKSQTKVKTQLNTANNSKNAGKNKNSLKSLVDEDASARDETDADSALFLEVEIVLSLSAHANVSRLFALKKAAASKAEKTLTASARVLQEKRLQVQQQLQQLRAHPTGALKNAALQHKGQHLMSVRKMHWFEKFHWFVTSEGFLVLSGRDAQQNDQLIRRHLSAEDVYVHANLAGAASCIVKARRTSVLQQQQQATINPGGAHSEKAVMSDKFFVSPLAIQEAGVFAVCWSRAWSLRQITSAYWVRASQVSKTAPSGEYLTTGAFMVYGKKHYLPPMPLEMGFGLLFRVSEEDYFKNGHATERRVKSYVTGWDEDAEDNDDPSLDGDHNNAAIDDDRFKKSQKRESDAIRHREVRQREERYGLSIVPTAVDAHESENDAPEGPQVTTDEVGDEEEVMEDLEPTSGSDVDEEQMEEDFPVDRNKESKATKQSHEANQGSQKKKTKKTLNKKKARRYAEQDDEDRELAMAVLGHNSNKVADCDNYSAKSSSKSKSKLLSTSSQGQSRKDKQAQAGIAALLPVTASGSSETGSATSIQDQSTTVDPEVVTQFIHRHLTQDSTLVAQWLTLFTSDRGLRITDLNESELQMFQQLTLPRQTEVLSLFQQGLEARRSTTVEEDSVSLAQQQQPNTNNKSKKEKGKPQGKNVSNKATAKSQNNSQPGNKSDRRGPNAHTNGGVHNKSAFLAGIIRRVLRTSKSDVAPSLLDSIPQNHEIPPETTAISSEAPVTGTTVDKDEATTMPPQRDDLHSEDEDEDEDENKADNSTANKQASSAMEEERWLCLVGTPSSQDTVLYAVPICAPYLSLQHSQVKYKVKLTPGTMKKGKAVKAAMDTFLHLKEDVHVSATHRGDANASGTVPNSTEKEKQLMKQVQDTELVSVMIGDVKLSMPGLQQQQQQRKKAQRNQKKQKNSDQK